MRTIDPGFHQRLEATFGQALASKQVGDLNGAIHAYEQALELSLAELARVVTPAGAAGEHVGRSEARSVLMYGEVFRDQYPVVRNLLVGWDAYDMYQSAVYLKQWVAIRQAGECDGMFRMLAGIARTCAVTEFHELGSTLFASIDRLENCLGQEAARALSFVGVEPSHLLREAAAALHAGYQVSHYESAERAPHPANSLRALHASYQATSYAFGSTDDLVDWLCRFGASLDGIWFSRDEMDEQARAGDGQLTLFSYHRFLEAMRARGYEVYLHSIREVETMGIHLYEAYLTSLRRDMGEGARAWVNAPSPPQRLADIAPTSWLEPRRNPVWFTSSEDTQLAGKALNFAGCYSDIWPAGAKNTR